MDHNIIYIILGVALVIMIFIFLVVYIMKQKKEQELYESVRDKQMNIENAKNQIATGISSIVSTDGDPTKDEDGKIVKQHPVSCWWAAKTQNCSRIKNCKWSDFKQECQDAADGIDGTGNGTGAGTGDGTGDGTGEGTGDGTGDGAGDDGTGDDGTGDDGTSGDGTGADGTGGDGTGANGTGDDGTGAGTG